MSDPLNRHSVTPENFRRIREVFESALERPLEERHAFVENACRGNSILLQEVERMLAVEGQSDPQEYRRPRISFSTRAGDPPRSKSCLTDLTA
jgi:hypothetical protein